MQKDTNYVFLPKQGIYKNKRNEEVCSFFLTKLKLIGKQNEKYQ